MLMVVVMMTIDMMDHQEKHCSLLVRMLFVYVQSTITGMIRIVLNEIVSIINLLSIALRLSLATTLDYST